jgi:dCTP deaminase
MVLSREQIRTRLDLPLSDPESLVITPLLCEDDIFDADSVDLRLGTHFLLPRPLNQPFFSPDRTSATSLHSHVHVPLGQYLVVPAHHTILGATLEFIKLPRGVSGQILTKSSVARTFILVETAPWIHPRYRGCLTLEIANVSNMPVLLYPGRSIGQLVLMEVGPDTEHIPGVNQNYFGPVYPEAPKFKNPEEDLFELGISDTTILKQARRQHTPQGWKDRDV